MMAAPLRPAPPLCEAPMSQAPPPQGNGSAGAGAAAALPPVASWDCLPELPRANIARFVLNCGNQAAASLRCVSRSTARIVDDAASEAATLELDCRALAQAVVVVGAAHAEQLDAGVPAAATAVAPSRETRGERTGCA